MTNSIPDFLTLVDGLCCRTSMYCCEGTYFEACAYISGYAHASPDGPLGGDGWEAFGDLVCAVHHFPRNYAWPNVIRECSRDDTEALEKLRRLVTEFATRTQTQSYDQIIAAMVQDVEAPPDGEPEQAWRDFAQAICHPSRDVIEPLIEPHPDAGIMWSGQYPEGVGTQLLEIAKSQRVRRIAGSEQDGQVVIATADFGPVHVIQLDGTWRIDASRIITNWKASRDAEQQEADVATQDATSPSRRDNRC